MQKILAIAAAAALSMAVPYAIANAAETKGGTAEANAPGAASNQEPGTATSNRTPQKNTATPENQVDRTKSGKTSDRSPHNKH
ncbi:MAG TPA: hypothetical protein VNR51_05650 [Hyphomicrobium sp.]|nr:hypothetical protein [Hyphomicrobium sp.]